MTVGPAAVALRTQGASFKDIADVLGLTGARAAISAVTTELQVQAAEDGSDRVALRAKETAHLDSLMLAVWDKAHDESHEDQIKAVRAAVAIIDRRIRLNGLDVPTEIVVHTPTANELEQWVVGMVSAATLSLEEGDIIDGTVIE